MSSSNPEDDPQYIAFKQWREQQGEQPPAYFADPEYQQFVLFQQLQAFQQAQQGGRATAANPARPPTAVGAQFNSPNSPNDTTPHDTQRQEEVQQLAATLSQMATIAQSHVPGEDTPARAERLEREFQQFLATKSADEPDDHPQVKVFDLSSQGVADAPVVAEQQWPRYVSTPRRSRRPLFLSLALLLAVLALLGWMVYSFFISPFTSPNAPALFASAKLEITQFDSYTNSSELHIVGLVKNNGNAVTNGVEVDGLLRDSKGRAAGSGDDTFLYNAPLAPGQQAGFDVRISSPPTKWDKLEVTAKERTYKAEVVSGLVVTATVLSSNSSGYKVKGEVRNSGPDDARSARVVVTAYDAAGKVLAVGQSYVDTRDGIDSGLSAPFSTTLYRTDIKIDHFDTYVFGEKKQ